MHAIQNCLRRFIRTLARFGRARDGNIAITFAIAVVPLLAFVGAAVDFSRANSMKASIQAALDATALMASKKAATMTAAEVQTAAQSYFTALFTRPEAKNIQITALYSTEGGSNIVVNGSVDMDTQFLGVIGQKKITVLGTSTARWGSSRLRVALVLDTTGSMDSDGKLDALKTSTKSLLTQLQGAASTNGDVYVSIVPFSRGVNVGASNYNADWIDWSEWEAAPAIMTAWLANSGNLSTWEQTGAGDNCPFTNNAHGFTCVKSSADGASSTSTVPSSGNICPSIDTGNKDGTKGGFDYPGCYNSVDTTRTISSGSNASCGSAYSCNCSGNGSSKKCTQTYSKHTWVSNARSTWTGCVADRGTVTAPGTTAGNDQTAIAPSTTDITTRYPARQDTYCPQAATALSYNWSAMSTMVDALDANGGTNQPVGLLMGWHSLVGLGPFSAPAKDPAYTYTDVVILMSDGLNTWDRWYGNGSSINTSVDYRMYDSTGKGTCANMKATVTLYTIQVNTGGDALSTLLQNCAGGPDKFSDPSKFYMVTTANGLGTVFTQIGTALTQLRVAK